MSLPSSYMTSIKRLPQILEAIQTAQAPTTFSTRFLEKLGFKAKGDRLIIGVLKDLRFLDEKGAPKERYYKFLDQSQSGSVLANGIRDAWSDLFAINVNAHQLSKAEFIGKLKTLSQGQLSDRVLDLHYMTFSALVNNADFTSHNSPRPPLEGVPLETEEPQVDAGNPDQALGESRLQMGGLVYNIQIVLPESRDSAVYDAIFRSLREHLR